MSIDPSVRSWLTPGLRGRGPFRGLFDPAVASRVEVEPSERPSRVLVVHLMWDGVSTAHKNDTGVGQDSRVPPRGVSLVKLNLAGHDAPDLEHGSYRANRVRGGSKARQRRRLGDGFVVFRVDRSRCRREPHATPAETVPRLSEVAPPDQRSTPNSCPFGQPTGRRKRAGQRHSPTAGHQTELPPPEAVVRPSPTRFGPGSHSAVPRNR